MRAILTACFSQTNEEYKEYLEQILVEHEFYKERKIIALSKTEIESIEFMIKSYNNSGQFPSRYILEQNFPQMGNELEGIEPVPLDDFRVYIGNLMAKKTNRQIAKKITVLNEKIETEGVTDELLEEMENFRKLSSQNKTKEINLKQDFKSIYAEKCLRPVGLFTDIPEIDSRIGGCSEGTITTIAGFTSHFKTTLALNIAYKNAFHRGFNIVYISFETPKEDMYFNLLCRHSCDPEFDKYPYIPHDKIRKCELNKEQQDYLYDVVEPNLHANFFVEEKEMVEENGVMVEKKVQKEKARGKVIILDESDFVSTSFTDIYNVLEQIDESLEGELHGFIVDYIQLCKFTQHHKGMDDNRIINSYVTFFRRLTQKFRSGSRKRKLIGILLSQINRENWKKASKKEGRYDLTCLADANELERGSYRVLTTYTDENMKAIREAQIQILKNRGGPTLWEPLKVHADGESYSFGEDVENRGKTLGGKNTSVNAGNVLFNIDTLIDDMDNSEEGW
jgi:replicative DNA helicase